jgi:hypothetical protein
VAGGASRLAFKILSSIVAIPVSKAIAKATGKVWMKARPENPPHNPKEVQTSWKDAFIFAGITGLGAAAAQVLTTKGADNVWRAMTGKPSPRPKLSKADRAKADEAPLA